MSDTNIYVDPPRSRSAADARPRAGNRTHRRIRRILIAAATSFLVIALVGAGSVYVAARQLTGNIHRIPNVFLGLDAAARPVMPAATRGSMTILLTGSDKLPAHRGGSGADQASQASELPSGLIAVVHINADQRAGAVVSIPPETVVEVPGHGATQIDNALVLGGPSLLIRTVEKLTNVRIDHYSVVDFQGLAGVLQPLGGVNVDVPDQTTSYGITFRPGIDHLNSAAALAYARQASISESDRVQREQNLLRAILDKIAADSALGNPVRSYSVINAFTKALSVDSDFSSSQLASFAERLHSLGGSNSTFVRAPVQPAGTVAGKSAATLDTAVSNQLWQAIRNDSVAAFASQYPATVTTPAPH